MININESINILEQAHSRGVLKYDAVSNVVTQLGLIVAEFGDCLCPEAHNGATDYCYWNVSGKREDGQAILIYYDFDMPDKNDRLTLAGTVKDLYIDRKLCGSELFKRLHSGERLNKYEAIQVVRLSGLKLPETVYTTITKRVASVEMTENGAVIGYYGTRKLSGKVFKLFNQIKETTMQA